MSLVLQSGNALPFPGTGWVVLVASLLLTAGWLLHIYTR